MIEVKTALRQTIRLLLILFMGVGALHFGTAQSNLEVSGGGFFRDQRFESRLAFLHGVSQKEPATLDAAFLEDSAFLLLQQMKREGYLKPELVGRFQVGEVPKEYIWDDDYSIQLDAAFVADTAEFSLLKGVRYYYDSVAVKGVAQIEDPVIQRYFIPGGVLLNLKSNRVFTYKNLNRRVGRLQRSLEQIGYREATLVNQHVQLDDSTGAVRVTIEVDEGPLHTVRKCSEHRIDQGGAIELLNSREINLPMTGDWEQAQRQKVRNTAFRDGYPDAVVELSVIESSLSEAGILMQDLVFTTRLGPKVLVGETAFRGDERTNREVLERFIDMEKGEHLNRLSAMDTQRRLMGLGIFSSVNLGIEPTGAARRDIIFTLTPNQRKELDLLAGWSSYELARVGFVWAHRNPFGRAHTYEIEAKQSFRASQLNATYSFPQFLGSDITTYLSSEYSFREEVSFDQSEQSIVVGGSKLLHESGVRLAVEYEFSKQDADRDPRSDFVAEDTARIGSLSLNLSLDRRDDFLAPTDGYSLFLEYAFANQVLGGSVNFQKIETGYSHHLSLTDSLISHIGLRGGYIFSTQNEDTNLPFNERFFSGGENSVRGYMDGEASPLDSFGDEIGSEAYVQGNFEIEQRLVRNVSLVGFYDVVATARDGFFEEGTETLSSVGLGIRYNTIVGPIRLEYGHNLDPRPVDPDGTLHFSIGFPF